MEITRNTLQINRNPCEIIENMYNLISRTFLNSPYPSVLRPYGSMIVKVFAVIISNPDERFGKMFLFRRT